MVGKRLTEREQDEAKRLLATKNRRLKQKKSLNAFQRRMSNPITAHGVTLAKYLNAAEESDRLHMEKLFELLKLKATQSTSLTDGLSDYKINGSIVHSVPPLDCQIEALLSRYWLPLLPEIYGYKTEEDAAAGSLLALYTEDLRGRPTLYKFRKCELHKGRAQWFFASRPDKQVCSERCRHKKMAATKRFKDSRSAYKRVEYWLAVAKETSSSIKNLSRSRRDQKTRSALQERLRVAFEKVEAAKQEREQLQVKEGLSDCI